MKGKGILKIKVLVKNHGISKEKKNLKNIVLIISY
jgi:hypothetical protein